MVNSRTEPSATPTAGPLRLRREAALLGGALALGVLVMPLLI